MIYSYNMLVDEIKKADLEFLEHTRVGNKLTANYYAGQRDAMRHLLETIYVLENKNIVFYKEEK